MNLLKSIKERVFSTEVLTEVQELPTVIKEYPKEVQEIHNEFNSAADNLLQEANVVIKEAESKDVEKVQRLEKLGFTQSKQVSTLRPLLDKAKVSKEQVQLIAYYRKHYPNNKFITEEQVAYICGKYSLLQGDISKFKGFVPEKNLREIEGFKILEKDLIKIYGSRSTYGDSIGQIKWDGGDDYRRYSNIRALISKPISLSICAPVKDMDTREMRISQGYKLENIPVPDPVVLHPVNGGYLIVSMWADETFDPSEEPILNN